MPTKTEVELAKALVAIKHGPMVWVDDNQVRWETFPNTADWPLIESLANSEPDGGDDGEG
jgi:hypothetical protein